METLDPQLVAELFVALWRREGWAQRDMTARHYAAVAAVVRGEPPAAIDLPGQVHARRTPEGFVIFRVSRRGGPCSRPAS